MSFPKRILGGAVSIAIIVVAGVLVWRHVQTGTENPLSDNATLTATVVKIAPAVPGRIIAMPVQNDDFVEKDAVLFEIDPEPYRLAVAQARANLAIAEAAREDQGRTIRASTANAGIALEQVERARTNLALAEQTLARLTPMLSRGYVSQQQVDEARTLRDDAQLSLNEALRQVEAADALVGTEAGAAALIAANRAALAIAEYELSNTVVRAPHSGRIAGLTVAPGDYVAPAAPLFSLIDTSTWYATAPYRETDLPQITEGNCATVYALSENTTPIRGVVEGTGWGVASLDVLNLPFSLPVASRSLDWVRVEQRFPVRIRLIDPPARLMRVGASAVTIVHHGNDC